MPPPTRRSLGPRRGRTCGSSAPGSEVAVGAQDAERAHRRAAADRLQRGDRSTGRDFRRARQNRPGTSRRGSRPTSRRRATALDRRDEMRNPASSRCSISSGHRTPGLAHAREVVPLEVDDHHVLGCVLGSSTSSPAGRVPLSLVSDPAAAREEALRRSRHDRPAVAHERPRRQRTQRRERGRAPPDGADRVLDEVHLVDVTARSPRERPRSPPRSRRRPTSAPTPRRGARGRHVPARAFGRIRQASSGSAHGSGGAGGAAPPRAADRP